MQVHDVEMEEPQRSSVVFPATSVQTEKSTVERVTGIIRSETHVALSAHRKLIFALSFASGCLLCVVVAISIKLATDLQTCNEYSDADRALIADFVSSPYEPNTWTEVYSLSEPPSGRLYAGACSVGNYLYLHGGVAGSDSWGVPYATFRDLWSFYDPQDTWTEVAQHGSVPPARFQHTLIVVDTNTLLVFGGFNLWPTLPGHQALSDLYKFDIASRTWTRLDTLVAGTAPTARGGHAAVVYNGALFVYGGMPTLSVTTGQYAELWKFTLPALSWTSLGVSGPEGRAQLSFVKMDIGSAYLSQGSCTTGVCTSAWRYFFANNSFAALPAPSIAGAASSLLYAPLAAMDGGLMFQFGGYSSTTGSPVGQLYALDSFRNAWMEWFPNFNRVGTPPATMQHCAVTIGNKVFIFGGRTNSSNHPGSSQLWQYASVPPV